LVHIEKLVCRGFKSFGRDTVTIRLKPGFTCIVGPNGSGKSNVIDAILFVLGQLSAKTLRATVFSDLLYSPPKPDMPPRAKSAVVEIHFENKDRKLSVDADKVVIERELDDSGKSVCRVNGKAVTRLQVLDVLGSIGVDPNGYNLVLQGEIAQMVKVSPIDRRKLIEEIAGISAYDEQKERSLKKLAESEANLSKVDAQLQERRRQLEKLELERADALRYQGVKQQIQTIKIDSVAWSVVKGVNRIKVIDETLAERAQDAERLVRELDEAEKTITETEQEIDAIDVEIDQITGGDSAKISEQYGVLSAAVEHVREGLQKTQAQYEKSLNDHRTLERNLESVKEQIEENLSTAVEKNRELAQVDREIQSCSDQILQLEQNLQKEQDSYYENQQRLQDLNNQMISLDEGVSDVRSAVKSDDKELGLAYEELRDSEESLKKTDQELGELTHLLPQKREALAGSESSEQSRRKEIEDITKRLTTIDMQVGESARLVNATREELIKIQARQDALKEAEEAFLKRERAVARVLEMRDQGELEGIHGTVSELGRIDPEYAVAMEIAGGNRLTHVVVDDEDVATRCISLLKREKVGRATFIPLNRIKSKAPGSIPDDKQVIGYALDLVEFDPKMRPAFEFVFADTLVTEDFESAKRMGLKGWRAVSLEGDLVEKSGLMTGGHFHKGKMGLSLQVEDNSPEVMQRLKGLEQILSDLRTQQNELREREKRLSGEVEETSKKNFRAKVELEGLEERLVDREARRKILTTKIEQVNVTVQALEAQIGELRARDTELSQHRDTVRLQRDKANEMLMKSNAAKMSQEIKDLKEVLDHQKMKREETASEVTTLQVGLEERLKPKSQELDLRLESLDAVLPGLEEEVKSLQELLREKETDFQALKSQREEIEETVKDKRVRQIELKESLRNLRLKHEETRESQTGNEKAVYRLQTERARLETDLVGLRAELGTMADAETETDKRLQEKEISYKDIEDREEKIRELERELEAMGAVNLKALTDYDAERNLYDEIVDKKTKLEEEHKEILSFMEELEREKTSKFLLVYNDIADNFAKVFAKLSPGGEAALMLENAEHPLMGGITVHSKPRGKELVSLDSMSGGEKVLTGLALIFAIQMYSPASFYVFDEIDAALDDVNAHNVALLISEMSKSSQFIVVSLRDITARKADLLVGVSNQDGISRIVPVDLEEVAEST